MSRDLPSDEAILSVLLFVSFLSVRMINIFTRTQSKVFSILSSDSEMTNLSSLFEIILHGVSFPSIQPAGAMISCLPLLMKPNDIADAKRRFDAMNDLRCRQIQNSVIERAIVAFVDCCVIHKDNSLRNL